MVTFPTKEQFYTWLAGCDPQETVGYISEPCSCPLATFLQDLGMDGATVNPDYDKPTLGRWSDSPENGWDHYLPIWANKFATLIDQLQSNDVSAEVAYGILNEVGEEIE